MLSLSLFTRPVYLLLHEHKIQSQHEASVCRCVVKILFFHSNTMSLVDDSRKKKVMMNIPSWLHHIINVTTIERRN